MTRTLGGRWLAMPLVALALLAACGGGRDDDDGDAATGAGADGASDTDAAGGVVDPADCDSYDAAPGVTDTEIKLGSSFPQSGTAAAFAEISSGYRAYFEYVNAEEDGIDGRRITLVTKDDGYEANRTQSNVDALVQEDGVFALFNVIGTPNNLAFYDDTDDQCVPNLFVGTGSPFWGDQEGHPWTIGSIPSYATEAAVFADYLTERTDATTVAILQQNDDFGNAYTEAFEKAIEGSDLDVVEVQTYESDAPDVTSQVTSLADTDADAFLGATTGLKCPATFNAIASSGWDPIAYVSATCTSPRLIGLAEAGATDGIISTSYLKDPLDPQWDEDEAMQLYKEKVAEYGPDGTDVTDTLVGYGWTMGALVEHALREATELTREAVMESAHDLQEVEVGLVLPGIAFNTSPEGDSFVVEKLQAIQYNGEKKLFDLLGGDGEVLPPGETAILDYEGKTADVAG